MADVILTPGAGSIVFTGQAPTLSIGTALTPGAGSIVVTGLLPAISTGIAYVNAQFAARPRVPQEAANEKQHRKMLANGVNRAIKGQIDCTFPLTLPSGLNFTQINDSRISKWTAVVMTPTTANAAAEMASGQCYVTVSDGFLTVTHRNNSQTDRTFQVALIG